MKRYRPRSAPLACAQPSPDNAVTYARYDFWRRSISREITQRFQQAQTFLQTGEAESAEAVCAALLDQHPEDANVLCLSARALVKLGRFDEANARIEHALSIYPAFARPHEVRGELSLAQGNLPDAAEAFQQAEDALSTTKTSASSPPRLAYTDDRQSRSISRVFQFTITIDPDQVLITTSDIPFGSVNSTYNTPILTTNGVGPFTWSVTAGAMPTGISLGATTRCHRCPRRRAFHK